MHGAVNRHIANVHERSASLGVAAIQDLDLDPIKIKLMDHEEGEGWSRGQADVVAVWYKRYLILNLKFPKSSVVPNKLIDTFWHYHILDTMKYADDCQNIFGHFFHHFPYFGMRSSDDAENLKKAFAITEALFWSEFGESLNDLINKFSGSDVLDAAKCKEGNCRSCKNTIGDFVEERPRLSLVR